MVGNPPAGIDVGAPDAVATFGNLAITGRDSLERHLRDIQCSPIRLSAGQRRPARRRPTRAVPSFLSRSARNSGGMLQRVLIGLAVLPPARAGRGGRADLWP